MKKLLPLLTLLAWVMIQAPQANAQQSAEAEWTIMMYGAMDNDLEAFIFADMHEIQIVGSSPQVNIVTQVDRAEGEDSRWGDWTDTRRFYLTQRAATTQTQAQRIEVATQYFVDQGFGDYNSVFQEISQIATTDPNLFDTIYENNMLYVEFDEEPIEILGEVDMGDPASVTDFVTWGITNYPADKYMLIMSSHGLGWAGLGPDYGNNDSMLLLEEIESGVRAALDATGVDKIDIIGFDACLMSQYEVATALQSIAHYSLAAEEVIPGLGWQYTTPIQALVDNPSMDALTFGQVIIDAYVEEYVAQGFSKVDLHLLDLGQLDQVTSALTDFDRLLSSDMTFLLSAFAAARQSAQVFGLTPDYGDDGLYSFIDLRDFMQRLYIQSLNNVELANAMDRVISAVDGTVAYSRADDLLPGANGISIYFPLNAQTYELFGERQGYPFASTGAQLWNGLLTNVHQTIATEVSAADLTVQITDAPANGSIYDPPAFFFNYDGTGISSIKAITLLQLNTGLQIIVNETAIARYLSIDFGGEVYEYIDYSPQPSNFFIWDAKMSVLTDGEQSVPVLLIPRGLGEAIIRGVLLDQNGNVTNDAALVYSGLTQEVVSLIAFAENGAPFVARPQPGTFFMPIWETLDENGFNAEASQVSFDLSFGLPQIAFQPVPDGMYTVGFEVRDLAGNATFDSAAITVTNSNLDPNWQAYKSLDTGVTFLYPVDWSTPQPVLRDDGSVVVGLFDPEREANVIGVAAYEGADAETVLADTQQRIYESDNPVIYDVLPLNLTYSPVGFEYEYSVGNTRLRGVRIIYDISENNRVYLVNLTVTDDTYDRGIEIINRLVESLTFFTPR